MAYSDKDRQRQANREAAKRYRQKGMTKPDEAVIPSVIPVDPELERMYEESRLAAGQVKAFDPGVQKIWDKRNAMGQPDVYPQPLPTCNLALPGDEDHTGVADQHPEWPRVGVIA